MSGDQALFPCTFMIKKHSNIPGKIIEAEIKGFYVPDTDNLWAVDERDEEEWFINHLPTGYTHHGFVADTREEAMQVAKRLHNAMKAHGCPVESSDPKSVAAPINALPADVRSQLFREIVAA